MNIKRWFTLFAALLIFACAIGAVRAIPPDDPGGSSIDWTADQGATNIHANNIPDLSGTYLAAGSAFNPAIPGAIGGTTPNQIDMTNFYLYGADVTHGMTSIAPTADYAAAFQIGVSGGLDLYGITEANQDGALRLTGVIGATDPTDSNSAMILRGGKANGTGWQALGAAESVLSIYNYTTQIGRAYGNGEWIFSSIQNTPIGSTIASTGDFTVLTASTSATIGTVALTDSAGSLASGGTLVSLAGHTHSYTPLIADPGANRIYGWDDTDNAYKLMVLGTGLAYNAATDTLSVLITSADLALAENSVFIGNASNVAAAATQDTLFTRTDSIVWDASAFTVDGTQCVAPTSSAVNSGPLLYRTTCADNDAGTIQGSVVMPDSWNASTITLEVTAWDETADPAGTLAFDASAMCRRASDTINGTFGDAIAVDMSFADAGTAQYDVVQTTSAAITPNGTCAAGALLIWQLKVDATTTDGATVANIRIHQVKMEFGHNAKSD